MSAERPDDPPATVIPPHAIQPLGPALASSSTADDPRGLIPLFWTHVNPYGKFTLDVGGRHEG